MTPVIGVPSQLANTVTVRHGAGLPHTSCVPVAHPSPNSCNDHAAGANSVSVNVTGLG